MTFRSINVLGYCFSPLYPVLLLASTSKIKMADNTLVDSDNKGQQGGARESSYDKQDSPIKHPVCRGMEELPTATDLRIRVARYVQKACEDGELASFKVQGNVSSAVEGDIDDSQDRLDPSSALFKHLEQGLALTVGSALGSTPPSVEECLAAFQVPNKALLTAGAKAWTKHAHRSQAEASANDEEEEIKKRKQSDGWWGTPSGPVARINERAVALFWRIIDAATWRNLHWLPHQVLVYEVRVLEGYGMRWSQNQGKDGVEALWTFRGFVEPMMENGHELGWRHAP
ncbi:hypothetical protein BKA70DRAFT_541709 [Coprinopsis sp. MPI-PUGE-AT-0042]|nr:hypothetical protein BKA70DRAFT_541709 [Coprinopsis sp. MPI-PUGE-AT-0042]